MIEKILVIVCLVSKLAAEVEKEKQLKQKKHEDLQDPSMQAGKKGAGGKKPAAVDLKKKKPAGGAKKGKEEEEVKIAVPSWELNQRTVMCYETDRIARHGMNSYNESKTKVMVAGNIELAVGVSIH